MRPVLLDNSPDALLVHILSLWWVKYNKANPGVHETTECRRKAQMCDKKGNKYK